MSFLVILNQKILYWFGKWYLRCPPVEHSSVADFFQLQLYESSHNYVLESFYPFISACNTNSGISLSPSVDHHILCFQESS